MDLARRREMAELLQERGIQTWLTPTDDETRGGPASSARRSSRGWRRPPVPRRRRSTSATSIERKIAALREHVTQLAADHFFLALTADDWRQFMPQEDFTLSESRVPIRIPEDDLFAGLPPRTDPAGPPGAADRPTTSR